MVAMNDSEYGGWWSTDSIQTATIFDRTCMQPSVIVKHIFVIHQFCLTTSPNNICSLEIFYNILLLEYFII